MKQTVSQQIKKKLEWLGHCFFYTVLVLGGQRAAYCFLYPVIFTYVLCGRKIHRATAPYFRRRFPSHNRLALRLDVFKNVLSFGKVLVDRGWMGLNPKAELSGRFADSEKLRAVIREGRGVVVLLAHVGNWQTCLVRLKALNVEVHALMEFDQERVSKHFFELRGEKPFNIIDVHGFLGGMIEATAALQKGDMVLMMADRLHQGRSASVDFLGSRANLPIAAYHLAATAGSPVVVLFAAKTGRKNYSLAIWDIFYPGRSGREKREEFVHCAQRFSSALEKYVEQYPYQWYNFFDIWAQ
ncbi:MAG TPA: lipid A biosynthesis acyltransferase [Desulfobacteraceae bacterium]|nr:lipid A biosynthesis acyltransferase [Desulfobacteraceae bacterium]